MPEGSPVWVSTSLNSKTLGFVGRVQLKARDGVKSLAAVVMVQPSGGGVNAVMGSIRSALPTGLRPRSGNTAGTVPPYRPTDTADSGSADRSLEEKPMSMQETQRVLEAYAASHDTRLVAPDAVFTDTASGQQYVGREAIAAMLDYVYHVAFDARAEVSNLIVGDGMAVLEAEVVGTHIGEFAGVPPTGMDVRIPLAVSYDIADGLIQRARVYLQLAAFLRQVETPAHATSR